MEEKKYSAKTLEDAITDATAELGVTSDKLDYTVIQESTKGFLGFRAKPCIISVRIKENKGNSEKKEKPFKKNFQEKKADSVKENAKPAVKENRKENGSDSGNNNGFSKKKPSKDQNFKDNKEKNQKAAVKNEQQNNSEKPAAKAENNARSEEKVSEKRTERKYEKTGTVTGDPVKTAEDFLTNLFTSMDMKISYSGKFNDENNELIVDLSGEDMGVLIGKRGQTLDALQYLTSQVVNKHQSAYIRVKLDTENYRERRKETMETLAQNIAAKVKKTKRPVALEPMNPYERRIIHSVLQSDKDIITRSEGVEPYRHVVVCPVRKKKSENTAVNTEE